MKRRARADRKHSILAQIILFSLLNSAKFIISVSYNLFLLIKDNGPIGTNCPYAYRVVKQHPLV
jgi:hypothetical protein